MLAVLKIIGIVLLILILVILLLVAAVLFVPIRYKVSLNKEKEWELSDLSCTACVSWFLHVLNIKFVKVKKDTDLIIRIAGIRFKPKNKEEQSAKSGKERKKSGKSKKRNKKKSKGNTSAKKDSAGDTTQQSTEDDMQGTPSLVSRIFAKIKRIVNVPLNILKKVRSKIRTFVNKVKKIYAKTKKWKDIISDERFFSGIKLLLAEMKNLVRLILPKKIWGKITFGFDDLSTTGNVVVIASMFYPLYGKTVDVTPDFENEVLECDLKFKGKIRLINIIKIAIKLYFDKNFKYCLDIVMNKED